MRLNRKCQRLIRSDGIKESNNLNPRDFLILDTETTGILPFHGCRVFAVSLADQDGNTWFCQWPVDPFTREVKPNPEDIVFLQRYLMDENLPKVCFNLKFDYRMVEFTTGIRMQGPLHDVYFQARVCNTAEPSYKLKVLAKKYVGVGNEDEVELQKRVVAARRQASKLGWKIATEETHGKGHVSADYFLPHQLDPADDSLEKYAVIDVMPRTLVLFLMYQEIMRKSPNLLATYEKEMQVFPILYKMEQRGIFFRKYINDNQLKAFREKAIRERQACINIVMSEGKIWYEERQVKVIKRTGERRIPPFNPNSNDHIKRILFNPEEAGGFGLEPLKLTDSGNESADWEALAPYVHIPFVRHLLHNKNAEKCVTSFFGNFNRFVVPDPLVTRGYCLHGNFNQMVSTGRMSCSDPPLQIIPNAETSARSYVPIQAREAFSPRPGYTLFKIDYSGQELRIFTHLAKIEELVSAYKRGDDVNAINADRVWGGRDNILALKAASEALELGDPTLPEQFSGEKDSDRGRQIGLILGVWKEIGWNESLASLGGESKDALCAVMDWLEYHDWSIYSAEKSVGKKKSRTAAKNFIYMKIYGGGIRKCQEQLRCSLADARRVMESFDRLYPGIDIFMQATIDKARQDGYITNDYGRRINVDKEKAYKAVNYWVQSNGADMMKSALIGVSEYIKSRQLDYHPTTVNHDELLLEVARVQATKGHLRRICGIMVAAGDILSVPAEVEIQRCDVSWNSGKEIKL